MKKYRTQTIVLKKTMTDEDVSVLVEKKKIDNFRSMLRKPKRKDVHVESVVLNYECVTMISGKYKSDYYRKAIHTVSVSQNVSEIVFGDGLFPVRSKSHFKRKISGKLGKNLVDLPLEEHAFIESEGEFYFDSGGKEIKFPFKINSKTIENYPRKILEKNKLTIIAPMCSTAEFISKLTQRLTPELEDEIRDLTEDITILQITEIYIPIFEVILFGPKKKTATMRIDAVRNKIL